MEAQTEKTIEHYKSVIALKNYKINLLYEDREKMQIDIETKNKIIDSLTKKITQLQNLIKKN